MSEDRDRLTAREREETLRYEKKGEEAQKQVDADAKQKRDTLRKEKEWKEKERVAKELEEKGLQREPRSKKGVESRVTEPASGSLTVKKGAKPKPAAPASTSGSSAVESTSKGTGAAKSASITWKSGRETMNYLLQLHATLYPSPKARDQKERIQALNRGFQAREKIRRNSYLQKQELTIKQHGYSRKKRKLHQQRMAEDHSQLSSLDLLGIQAEDEDAFDSEADEESDRLEQSLLKERDSQIRWKKEHQQAMEEWDHRAVVSQKVGWPDSLV